MTTCSTRFVYCKILLIATSFSSDTPATVTFHACIMHSALHLLEGTRKHHWPAASLAEPVPEPSAMPLSPEPASSLDVLSLNELFRIPSTLSACSPQPSGSQSLSSCFAFQPLLTPLPLLSAPYC
jgi:hypothetical protein